MCADALLHADALQRRHEFVLFFDVKSGNPNGDPDAGNVPRMDPETGHGLVGDVCLKRKIRNYVEIAKSDAQRFRIYVTESAVLNEKHREAYVAVRPGDAAAAKDKKLTPKSDDEAAKLRGFRRDNFYDIRTFGGVLSTGINAGQVRGPVQIGFAQSVEPVLPLEISITRMAATNEAERKDRIEGDDEPESAATSAPWAASILSPTACTAPTASFPPRWRTTRARAPASTRPTSIYCSRRCATCSSMTARPPAGR